jgi:hypothetical protein
MNPIPLSLFLRRILWLDAATCLITGAVMLAAAGTVERFLAIPAPLSAALGIALLAFGAAVAWVGARPYLLRPAVWAIVLLNALWAIESLLALAFGWLEPNLPGRVFIIGQAIAVAVIAELQFVGLRRARQVTA